MMDIPAPIVRLVMLTQPEKADAPRVVTLSGIVTPLRPVQPENADVPMLLTCQNFLEMSPC